MKTLFLILTLLSGCAYPKRTTPYKMEPPSTGKASIYIYRTPTSIDSLNPEIPKFSVNGATVGKLSIGGYYHLAVEPGEAQVSYKDSIMGIYPPWNSRDINFVAKSDEKYFIKYSIESVMRIVTFKLVSNSQGEEEIKSTDLLVN